MTMTILLSRVLGLYLILVGAIIIFRRHEFIAIFAGFVRERLVRVIVGLIVLLGGLFLLVQHQDWTSAPAAIVTLLAWIAVLEALLYMSLSETVLERTLRTVNRPAFYVTGGLFSIALGLYLTGYGFGYIGG